MSRARRPSSRKAAARQLASLTDQAYERLEEMIATLQLKPGAIVSEAELIKVTGIGRTPVREAMQRLAQEQVLRILPRRGCIIAESRLDDELGLIEARRAIETLIIHAAALRANPEQRRRFREIARSMTRALETANFDAFARLDAEFNSVCLVASGNPTAVAMARLIATLSRRFWFIHHGKSLPHKGVECHIAIADAIAGNDIDGAIRNIHRLHDYVERLARKQLPLSTAWSTANGEDQAERQGTVRAGAD